MIYSSASVVLDLGKQQAWDFLVDAVQNLQQYADDIDSIKQVEEYYDGALRAVSYANGLVVQERMFLLKDSLRILLRLEDHPLYKGEMVFQIVSVDDEFLIDKKSTVACVLSWRIHPGMIEAPIIDKQPYVSQILQTMQQQNKVEY